MKLYHVSYDISQNKIHKFDPRVPEDVAVNEEIKTPRICFADSILNCLRGISGVPKLDGESALIRVYEFEISEDDENLIKWNELYYKGWVPDASLTHEYWYLKSVCLDSKVFRIKNISKSRYLVVEEKMRDKVIAILRENNLYNDKFEDYDTCKMINEGVRKGCEDSEEILSKIKGKLFHIEKNEDLKNAEIYYKLFKEYPEQNKRVYDYYEIELIDEFICEEVGEEELERSYIFKKCYKEELLLDKKKFRLQLAWEIISEDYIWKNDCCLYKIENLLGNNVAYMYYSIINGEHWISQFEVVSSLRGIGHGSKIIEKFLDLNNLSAEEINLLATSNEAAEFWNRCNIKCDYPVPLDDED